MENLHFFKKRALKSSPSGPGCHYVQSQPSLPISLWGPCSLSWEKRGSSEPPSEPGGTPIPSPEDCNTQPLHSAPFPPRYSWESKCRGAYGLPRIFPALGITNSPIQGTSQKPVGRSVHKLHPGPPLCALLKATPTLWAHLCPTQQPWLQTHLLRVALYEAAASAAAPPVHHGHPGFCAKELRGANFHHQTQMWNTFGFFFFF